MMYFLGVLTGIAFCTFVAVILKRYETAIHRTIKQTESKLKRKGNIIEPVSEDLQDWVDSIKV